MLLARIIAFVVALIVLGSTNSIWIAGVVGAVVWGVLEAVLAAMAGGPQGETKDS